MIFLVSLEFREGSCSFLLRSRLFIIIFPFILVLPHIAGVFADTDVFWHLKGGLDILRFGWNPEPDPYTFSPFIHPWINHEWLAEVIFSFIYKHYGFVGLTFFRCLVLWASLSAFGSVLLQRAASKTIMVLLLAFMTEVISFFFNIQPGIFSAFLFTMLLIVCDKGYTNPKCLWLIPPILLFWVNMHGAWVLGLLTLILFLAEQMIEGRKNFRLYAVVLLLSLMATCLNPFGILLHRYILQELTTAHTFNVQWRPLQGEALLVPVIFLLVPYCMTYRSGYTMKAYQFILVCILCVATVRSQRTLPFLAIATLFAVPKRPSGETETVQRQLFYYCILVVFILRGLFGFRSDVAKYGLELKVDEDRYPVRAVRFIEQNYRHGDIALPLQWGGYVLWTLPQTYRVSMDGRNITLYSPEAVDDNVHGYVEGDLRRFLNGLSPDLLLIKSTGPLIEAVSASSVWQLAYHDAYASVFTKSAS